MYFCVCVYECVSVPVYACCVCVCMCVCVCAPVYACHVCVCKVEAEMGPYLYSRNAYHGASPYLMGVTALSTWRYNTPTGFGMQQVQCYL